MHPSYQTLIAKTDNQNHSLSFTTVNCGFALYINIINLACNFGTLQNKFPVINICRPIKKMFKSTTRRF